MARLYVGTYTQPEDHVEGHGEGIYCYQLDEETWALTRLNVTGGITNPSFLTLKGTRLYAVSEITSGPGQIGAFAVDAGTGRLMHINHQSTLGAAPCYVTADDHHVLVANYLGGSVAVLPIDSRGGIGPASDHTVRAGTSVHEERQTAPHPHAIVLDHTRRYALVPDLGTDTVTVYRYDRQRGRLLAAASELRTHLGAGPRHLTFDQSGRFAYLMNELDSTIMVCRFEGGRLTTMQTVEALPKSFAGTPSGADIHLHPSGRFLYASLRGLQCIIRMRVDPGTGRLTGRAYAHVLGTTPRNFAVDPKGRYLVVANQDSDSLVVMSINADTGLLTLTGSPVPVSSPACVIIAPCVA